MLSNTVVTLDWDFGEFLEVINNWPGFPDVSNAISARFPDITPNWLAAAMAVNPRGPGLDLWIRK